MENNRSKLLTIKEKKESLAKFRQQLIDTGQYDVSYLKEYADQNKPKEEEEIKLSERDRSEKQRAYDRGFF
jgi:hypothetical protein